jgi:VWFA-related protein
MRHATMFVLLLLSLTVAAQPRTSETIEVSIVNVDVVVTDREGKRVTGLTAEDFEIREAGKPQNISNFAEYGATAGEASIEGTRTISAAVPRAPRTLVLFIEAQRMLPFDAKRIFAGMRALVSDTIESQDRVMIVSWFTNGMMHKLVERQPFTNDAARVNALLAQMENEAVHGPRDLDSNVLALEADEAALLRAAGTTGTVGSPSVHTSEAALRERYLTRKKAAALETLMHSIAGFEGRKVLLMAVERFGAFSASGLFGNGIVPIERRQELSNRTLHDSLISTANATGVSIYPVYPPGLRSSLTSAATANSSNDAEADLAAGAYGYNVLFNQTLALNAIADDTGGLTAWGAGNIAEMLPRMAEDLETYYSLGYRAPGNSRGIVRKLEVRAKNRAYKVRNRAQFVEKSETEAIKDRVIANLYQSFPGSIEFEIEAGEPRSTGRNRWELPLTIRIPISELTALPDGGGESGEFSVYAAAGSVLGVTSEVQRRTQSFKIPETDLENAKASHFTYDLVLQIDEKSNRVSVGVVDETGREAGFQQIAIPNRTVKAASR